MGHGDDLILADANFPADSVARSTTVGRALRVDRPVVEVAKAVLGHYPLDTFVDDASARMEVVDSPDEIPPVQEEMQAVIDQTQPDAKNMIAIERFAFYERAKKAYVVVQTSERRFYGCFAFRKGVIKPRA